MRFIACYMHLHSVHLSEMVIEDEFVCLWMQHGQERIHTHNIETSFEDIVALSVALYFLDCIITYF